MRSAVRKLGAKKAFLDSIQIAVAPDDFEEFMKLYRFPNDLKAQLMKKAFYLKQERVGVSDRIQEAATKVRAFVLQVVQDFM